MGFLRRSSGEAEPPGARERSRMRRRLRRQRQMREALLLDLGALVFELHRHGRREPELLQAKAAELTAVDQEVRALADALGGDQTVMQLVATGIAGSCEQCGALMSVDSRYCASCGAPAVPALTGDGEPGAVGAGPSAEPTTDEQAALETGEGAPWGRGGGEAETAETESAEAEAESAEAAAEGLLREEEPEEPAEGDEPPWGRPESSRDDKGDPAAGAAPGGEPESSRALADDVLDRAGRALRRGLNRIRGSN